MSELNVNLLALTWGRGNILAGEGMEALGIE